MGKTSWMISDDVSNLVTMLQSRSDVAWTMTLGELPSYLDLYKYFNIEMAIVLFQWVSFAAMPSRTLNPLSVVTVGSNRVYSPFRSWRVIGLSSSLLLLAFGFYVTYMLHCIIILYKSL